MYLDTYTSTVLEVGFTQVVLECLTCSSFYMQLKSSEWHRLVIVIICFIRVWIFCICVVFLYGSCGMDRTDGRTCGWTRRMDRSGGQAGGWADGRTEGRCWGKWWKIVGELFARCWFGLFSKFQYCDTNPHMSKDRFMIVFHCIESSLSEHTSSHKGRRYGR